MNLVFDIGATTSRLALADGESLVSTVKFSTAQDVDEEIAQLREAVRGLAKEPFSKAVGGVAGQFDAQRTTLLRSPNLRRWEGTPLAERFRDAFGVPVTLENDAALAGLGEAVRGAGKGKSIVAYLTVSTGVGGARIVDGALDEKAYGFEPGAMLVRDDKTLEECVGGNALARRYGKEPKDIRDPAVWERASRDLATGLADIVALWSPDVVVLGGGMVLHDAFDLAKLSARVATLRPKFVVPPIRKASLGDLAGLIGAIVFCD